VVEVLVQAGGSTFTCAAALLVLLLQRADPGLRAAFLNGPEASLLLSAMLLWGRHHDQFGDRGAPWELGVLLSRKCDWETGASHMLACLIDPDTKHFPVGQAASAAWVLAHCNLEPAAPRHLDGQQQPQLVATAHGPSVFHCQQDTGERSRGCHAARVHLQHTLDANLSQSRAGNSAMVSILSCFEQLCMQFVNGTTCDVSQR
jgi:hypothetical protein